ncbi:MAG: hypothetical protein R3F11_26470 [Verrucomicrobiales bacterium]
MRAHPEQLLALNVRSAADATALPEPTRAADAPLRELVSLDESISRQSRYHKNLMPVTFSVIGDVAA